jgi:hypothetical protein
MRPSINLTGKQFGRLTVIGRASKKSTQIYWDCKCECGNEKVVQGGHLRSGHTKSCGCSWYQHGNKHKSWKGYHEISSKFFKSIAYNASARKLNFEVTIEELWQLFLKQERKCALSGLPLQFEANNKRIVGNASLDRKDATQGYTLDNVQWVHTTINQMKWDMPQDQFLLFCKTITNYNERR